MRERRDTTWTELVVSRQICRAAFERKEAFAYNGRCDTPIDPRHSMIDLRIAVLPCIEREGSSMDKFAGDAILAVW